MTKIYKIFNEMESVYNKNNTELRKYGTRGFSYLKNDIFLIKYFNNENTNFIDNFVMILRFFNIFAWFYLVIKLIKYNLFKLTDNDYNTLINLTKKRDFLKNLCENKTLFYKNFLKSSTKEKFEFIYTFADILNTNVPPLINTYFKEYTQNKNKRKTINDLGIKIDEFIEEIIRDQNFLEKVKNSYVFLNHKISKLYIMDRIFSKINKLIIQTFFFLPEVFLFLTMELFHIIFIKPLIDFILIFQRDKESGTQIV